DMNHGIHRHDARPRVGVTNGRNARSRRSHELLLELVAASPLAWVDVALVATAPRPERDLVDGAVERHLRKLVTHQCGHGAGKAGEALDELRRPDVDVVGKTVVTDIPDGLGSGLPGGMQLWQEAGPVIAARPALDAMPSQAVSDGRDPVPLQGLVVQRRKDV